MIMKLFMGLCAAFCILMIGATFPDLEDKAMSIFKTSADERPSMYFLFLIFKMCLLAFLAYTCLGYMVTGGLI